MTNMSSDVPDQLLRASKPLISVEGFECLEDWTWHESRKVWAIRFKLDIGAAGNSLVPPVTEWYALVTERYPIGRIRVLPARDHGLTRTFHHQRLNRTLPNVPWTSGTICVDVPGYLLQRLLPTAETFGVDGRLLWHVDRAKAWLLAAAANDLVRAGERFELPEFSTDSTGTRRFAFSEGVDSTARWASIPTRKGLVRLTSVPGDNRQRIVPLAFLDLKGQSLVNVSWGNLIPSNSKADSWGGWLMLPGVPSLAPWQAPATWGELCDAAARQRMNLAAILTGVFGHLRDGVEHVLLVGFQIPELVEGPLSRIHWQALALPRLSTLKEASQGFRPTAEGAMRRDFGTVLTTEKSLKWIQSDNWDRDSWTSRGRLNFERGVKVVILGLGAVGSAMAEMLVRGGVETIVLIDGDDLEPGNLVRHTLTLKDEGKNKASALADHLNNVSPNAKVEAIAVDLDSDDSRCRAAVEQADLVVDCTANDYVLSEIHMFSWKQSAKFVSLAIGLNAERMYVYCAPGWSFSIGEFRQVVEPLIQRDYAEHPGIELPQEAIGCWHPVFPAKSSDIWLLGSLAVKELEALLATNPTRAELRLLRFDGQVRREVIVPNGG